MVAISNSDGAFDPLPPTTRLTRLDGLRGLAAAGVAVHHIFFFFAAWQFSNAPLAPLASWIQHYGWTLVDLFFILSGYVFAHVYLRNDTLSSEAGIAAFWAARIARLWPLHLMMLVLIAVFNRTAPANTAYAFVAHLVMLQAFVAPVAGTYDWSSWSLSVEVFCYAIFAVAASRGRQTLLWTTLLLIAVSLIGLTMMSAPGGPHSGGVFRRGLLGFFLGQIMWQFRGHLLKLPTPLLLFGIFAGLWLQVGPYTPVLPLSLLTWPSVLMLTLRLKVMESPALVWLGDRSYAIYLINLPLTQSVVFLSTGHKLGTSDIVAIQAAIAVSVLLAAEISYRWVETPSRHSIRQLWARRQGRSAANENSLILNA
jgi:peptidoglycan/LPS O-acetylase OafA/YrhL